MSRPCPRCQTLKTGAFYRDNGEFICTDCEEAVIRGEEARKKGKIRPLESRRTKVSRKHAP